MGRLIDVDALIDDCKRYLNTLNPERDGKECTRIHWLIGVLENAPTVEPESRWISVKERLPENDERVLICGVRGGIAIARKAIANPVFGEYAFWVQGNKIMVADAWQPLPDLYVKESETE